MNEFVKWSAVLNLNMSSCLDKRLARFEINSSQYFYIMRICQNPGLSRERIMETVYRNPSNVTRALAQLEEKGYIRREPSREDRRTCHLYPTEKALRDCEEILEISRNTMRDILEPFDEKERELLPELLKKAGLRAFEINRLERKKEKEEGGEC